MVYSVLTETCSLTLTLPPPSLPLCVYMWRPSRLEALPGPRCSLSTPRFQRGSRALQQQAAHTARTCKDQEPGEDNLLHINTDLPVSCLSHWFCFLARDGLGSELVALKSCEWGMSHRVSLAGLGPLSACHQEVNSYWLLNKWLQCVGVRGLFSPHTLPALTSMYWQSSYTLTHWGKSSTLCPRQLINGTHTVPVSMISYAWICKSVFERTHSSILPY